MTSQSRSALPSESTEPTEVVRSSGDEEEEEEEEGGGGGGGGSGAFWDHNENQVEKYRITALRGKPSVSPERISSSRFTNAV